MRVFGEMWSRRQAASFLPLLLAGWLTGETSEALTTFGKSNTQPPNQPAHPTPPPGRPCTRQSECLGLSGTSCVRTQYEPTTRCLCGDNYAPVNGRCDAQTKHLYHVCSNTDECIDGLACGVPNITGTTPLHLRVLNHNDKICLCDTETGYREKDYTCNDGEILKTSIFAILLVVCIRKLAVN